MPRTRSLAWSELKIGIIAVAAMILAAMIIVAVGGAAGFSWQRYQLKTKFPDVKGIKSGAVVRVAGVEVGKVTDVQFAGAEVEVILEVKKGNEQRITSVKAEVDLSQPGEYTFKVGKRRFLRVVVK